MNNYNNSDKYIKELEDLKMMIKKKENLNKLTKNQLIKRIEDLDIKIKKDSWIKKISSGIAIILGIIVISSYILPAFADVDINYGKEIEFINNDTGVWKITITDGFVSDLFKVKNEKIILRVEFEAGINIENDVYFDPTPNKINIDEHNVKEYYWDILQGNITVQFVLHPDSEFRNHTWLNVKVRTSTGLKYVYPG